VSAQQSRIKKKEEVIFLNKAVREKDEKFKEMIEYVTKKLKSKELMDMYAEMQRLWCFQDMPQPKKGRQTAGDGVKLARTGSRTFGNGRMNKDASGISAYSLYDHQQMPDSSREIVQKVRETLIENFATK